MIIGRFALTSAFIFLFGCSQTLSTGDASQLAGQAGNQLVSFAADLAVRRDDRLPEPQPEINFENTTEFDLQLYSSLRRLPGAKVRIQGNDAAVPTRLSYWLSRVDQSDGETLTCDTNSDPGLAGGAFAAWLLGELASWALGEVRTYALYRPAESMNAVIEKNSATDRIEAVSFYPRSMSLDGVRNLYIRCAD